MKHRKIFGKAVIVFMAAVMCLSSLMTVPVSAEVPPTYEATEGWGAAADGIYYISSPQDLLAFAKAAGTGSTSTNTFSGKTVKLTEDIDLNPGWTAAKGASAPTNVWAPISKFSGTFDGQGYSISGLYSSGTTNQGFVWRGDGATFKNTRILNSYFATSKNSGGSAYVGGFVASVSGAKCTFQKLYVDAVFETTSAMPTAQDNNVYYIGGIVGGQYGGNAEYTDCVFAGDIYTHFKGIGGFTGGVRTNDYSATYNNCVSIGTITLDYAKNAAAQSGILGEGHGAVTMNNCVVYTQSPPASNYGGAVMYIDDNNKTTKPAITLNDVYYYEPTDNTNYSGVSAHPGRCEFTVKVNYDGTNVFNDTGDNTSGNDNTFVAALRKSVKSFTSSDELRSKAAFASFEQIKVGGKDYLIPESVANMQFGESHVAYAGYQLSAPADKLVNLRMVATTDTEPSKVGFEFTVTKGGKSGSDKAETTTVYTSVLANYGTQKITAAELEGDYIYALVLGGISAEGDVTVIFRAYEIASDGSVRYTAMRTVELTNGDDNVSN